MSVEKQDSFEPSITAVWDNIFLPFRSLGWRGTKFHPMGKKDLLATNSAGSEKSRICSLVCRSFLCTGVQLCTCQECQTEELNTSRKR